MDNKINTEDRNKNKGGKYIYCLKCKSYPDEIITRADMKVYSRWDEEQEQYVETDFDYKGVNAQYCGNCGAELT
jgi:hypothetical protein